MKTPGTKTADDSRPRIQSAVRTMSVLQSIAQSSDGLKAKEISDQLRLPRQVIYHLLHTLLGIGVVRKTADNRYVLGLAIAPIAEGFRRQLAPPEHLAPMVRAAVSATGETCYASGWVEGRIAILATAPGRSLVQAAEVPHGYSGHGHARATGKLLLALAGPTVRDTYLDANPLVALTANTITDRAALVTELHAVAEQGYAVDDEEFSPGLCCLAVPIHGGGGHFALGMSVPTDRFRARFEQYLAALREVAGSTPA